MTDTDVTVIGGMDWRMNRLEQGNWWMELEKWNVLEQLRSVGILIVSLISWFARVLLVFLPNQLPVYGFKDALHSLSHLPVAVSVDSVDGRAGIGSKGGAIGRSLSQVLALMNDLPITSRKYVFTRDLAEKIIIENSQHGYAYRSVNRVAILGGFARTLTLLTRCLELQQQNRSLSWSLPWKLVRMLPSAGMSLPLPPPLAALRSRVGGFLQPGIQESGLVSSTPHMEKSEMAEKLSQELLWLAEKLADCSALEDGIVIWSSATCLASASLGASPRIQRSLVRLSALFVKEIVQGKIDVGRDITFKLLLQWMPLFCIAAHGGEGLMFNSAEKIEAERVLEKAIVSLSDTDQEIIFSVWLQEFVLSSSDWPNLQSCYDLWRHSIRKLTHLSQPTECLDGAKVE